MEFSIQKIFFIVVIVHNFLLDYRCLLVSGNFSDELVDRLSEPPCFMSVPGRRFSFAREDVVFHPKYGPIEHVYREPWDGLKDILLSFTFSRQVLCRASSILALVSPSSQVFSLPHFHGISSRLSAVRIG